MNPSRIYVNVTVPSFKDIGSVSALLKHLELDQVDSNVVVTLSSLTPDPDAPEQEVAVGAYRYHPIQGL